MEIKGSYWAFWTFDLNHNHNLICPGMLQLKSTHFDVEKDGLKANFYDSSLFHSRNEAIDSMIKQLESLKHG